MALLVYTLMLSFAIILLIVYTIFRHWTALKKGKKEVRKYRRDGNFLLQEHDSPFITGLTLMVLTPLLRLSRDRWTKIGEAL